MARVLGVVAGLLWVAGIVVLVVGAVRLPDSGTYDGIVSAVGGEASGSYHFTIGGSARRLVDIGTVLVTAAGVLTGGLVLRHGRRRAG